MTQKTDRRRTWRGLLIAGIMAGCALAALGQDASPSAKPEEPAGQPTEYGLRLTPGMARAIGTVVTREVLVRRYQLDQGRVGEATEKIARRLMAAAHANDKQAQEFLEFVLPELIEAEARGQSEGDIPRAFWMESARRSRPFVPEVRRLIGDIRQDVQPLLPPTQQFKMAGDLLTLGAGLDAFEKTMERWSKGEDVDPRKAPFEPGEGEVKKDANGESEALKQARQRAGEKLDSPWRSVWERYVEQAKKLYAFDEAQSATADSLLREAIQRADTTAKDETWRRRALRNRLWDRFMGRLGLGWPNPLTDFIQEDFVTILEPVDAIGNELKDRIDKIPTDAQRQAADARALAAIGGHGADRAGK